MSDHTHIEWTDATWNPVTGCSVVSPGCTNCYAMRLAGSRLQHHPSRAGLTQASKAGPVWTGEVRFNPQWLDQPLRWRRPRRIFVCAHGDLFHERVPDAWIDQVFAVMALAPQHQFQVLTKRADRMRAYVNDPAMPRRAGAIMDKISDEESEGWFAPCSDGKTGWLQIAHPLPNVWLGVSAEDQARADERIPDLMESMATVRFVSLEPLLAAIDLTRIPNPTFNGARTNCLRYASPFGKSFAWPDRLDWVIVGGESGPGARPMHPDWARQIRDACAAAQVPFFFKQWGEFAPAGAAAKDARAKGFVQWHAGSPQGAAAVVYNLGKAAAGRTLDGVTHDAMPEVALEAARPEGEVVQ